MEFVTVDNWVGESTNKLYTHNTVQEYKIGVCSSSPGFVFIIYIHDHSHHAAEVIAEKLSFVYVNSLLVAD